MAEENLSQVLIQAVIEDDVERIKSLIPCALSARWMVQARDDEAPFPAYMLAAMTGSCEVIKALNLNIEDLRQCDNFNVFQYAIIFNQPKAYALLCFLAGKQTISPYLFRFSMIDELEDGVKEFKFNSRNDILRNVFLKRDPLHECLKNHCPQLFEVKELPTKKEYLLFKLEV